MFVPIGDDNTKRVSFPVVTILLIIANVIIFFLEMQGGDAFIYKYSVIPADFTSGNFPAHTLFTSMFLHGGWGHLIGNMLYLYVFGDNIEDNMGKGRFLVFYLLCGLAADVSQIAVTPNSTIPTLGASGAISGVLAGYLILFPRNRVRVLMGFFVMHIGAWLVLGLWIATQLISGYTDLFRTTASEEGGIAYMAHIGGFFAGLILTFFLRRREATLGLQERFRR